MRPPDFWNGRSGSAHALSLTLAPLGWAYGASVRWKAQTAKPYRSKAKVVCIGNLTVGGSGKTPVAIAVAQTAMKRGKRAVILSRGYGGRMRGPAFVHPKADRVADVGDEALMAAACVRVIVARDRAAGARLADVEETDIIVMDDGHQNFSVAKDLSIVVVDGESGFGNGRMIPAGPLREPVAQGLARSDAVIVTGDGLAAIPQFGGPVLKAQLKPAADTDIRGKKVVAFAGIGRPQKFFASLRGLGADLAEQIPFPDHHVYSASEIARLKAKGRGAILMTTEKDYVRLTPDEREGIRFLPVQAVFDDPAAFEALLDRVAPRAIPPQR